MILAIKILQSASPPFEATTSYLNLSAHSTLLVISLPLVFRLFQIFARNLRYEHLITPVLSHKIR